MNDIDVLREPRLQGDGRPAVFLHAERLPTRTAPGAGTALPRTAEGDSPPEASAVKAQNSDLAAEPLVGRRPQEGA